MSFYDPDNLSSSVVWSFLGALTDYYGVVAPNENNPRSDGLCAVTKYRIYSINKNNLVRNVTGTLCLSKAVFKQT